MANADRNLTVTPGRVKVTPAAFNYERFILRTMLYVLVVFGALLAGGANQNAGSEVQKTIRNCTAVVVMTVALAGLAASTND
jgi:hypothetical protein